MRAGDSKKRTAKKKQIDKKEKGNKKYEREEKRDKVPREERKRRIREVRAGDLRRGKEETNKQTDRQTNQQRNGAECAWVQCNPYIAGRGCIKRSTFCWGSVKQSFHFGWNFPFTSSLPDFIAQSI